MNRKTKITLAIVGSVVFILLVVLVIYLVRTVKNDSGSSRLNSRKINCNSKFLFIGDSNTVNPASFADKLKENCPGIQIKKLAKNGEKTDWMLGQYGNELGTGNKYDVVNVLAGSNDIFALLNISGTKINLQRMYDAARATGAIVVAITPPNKSFYPATTAQHRALIQELTDWIKNNKSVDVFIDLGAMSNDVRLFAADHQHLNAAGNEMLKNEYLKRVFTT